MLIREGGVETLKQLEKTYTGYTKQATFTTFLQSLCQSILETLELNS